MTPDYRALCAELADALAEWRLGGGPPEDTADADLIERARALLAEADGPAVPDGREPASVTLQPSDGDVAELVEFLREQVHACLQVPWTPGIRHFGRAAFLLEQRHPTPVPLSERLPGPEDCNAEGMCWWLIEPYPRPVGPGGKLWSLCRYFPGSTHWLPANALPTPDATND